MLSHAFHPASVRRPVLVHPVAFRVGSNPEMGCSLPEVVGPVCFGDSHVGTEDSPEKVDVWWLTCGR
jgi:hypothetical protein